jgi:phosphoribosylformylglycinamidine (FGAM) synthase-like amidotransferase family enzyme
MRGALVLDDDISREIFVVNSSPVSHIEGESVFSEACLTNNRGKKSVYLRNVDKKLKGRQSCGST